MTRIAIGSDHAGYELKQHLISFIEAAGHTVDDQGTHSTESVDYPEICAGVGRTVRDGNADFGIVLGGSGQGGSLRPRAPGQKGKARGEYQTSPKRVPVDFKTGSEVLTLISIIS